MTRARLIVAAALAGLPAAAAAADSWTLAESAWARPRDGRAIVSMAPLPQVVRAWSRRGNADLVVRYAGGESGELWAAELGDWLVALGVRGSAIRTVPGGEPGVIEFEVTGDHDP